MAMRLFFYYVFRTHGADVACFTIREERCTNVSSSSCLVQHLLLPLSSSFFMATSFELKRHVGGEIEVRAWTIAYSSTKFSYISLPGLSFPGLTSFSISRRDMACVRIRCSSKLRIRDYMENWRIQRYKRKEKKPSPNSHLTSSTRGRRRLEIDQDFGDSKHSNLRSSTWVQRKHNTPWKYGDTLRSRIVILRSAMAGSFELKARGLMVVRAQSRSLLSWLFELEAYGLHGKIWLQSLWLPWPLIGVSKLNQIGWIGPVLEGSGPIPGPNKWDWWLGALVPGYMVDGTALNRLEYT